MTSEFELDGHAFVAINGGQHVDFTDTISLLGRQDAVIAALSDEGVPRTRPAGHHFGEKCRRPLDD
jgi:hypothetical protein